jgi:hypothetical protein
MFPYQIFYFVQLVRDEAVISGKRHRADPEFGFITCTRDVDVGGLVSFIAIKLKAIATSRNPDRWHEIRMAAAFSS